MEGIAVKQNLNMKILSAEDLKMYTPLRLGSVSSKLHAVLGIDAYFELASECNAFRYGGRFG